MQSYNKYSSMDSWLNAVLSTRHKVPQPIATFPAAHILGCTVESLAKNPAGQAMGIKLMADKYNMSIAMGLPTMLLLPTITQFLPAVSIFS